MEKHNKIAPSMGSKQFIQGLPSRLHEINALMTLALSALHDGKHREAALETLTLASAKLDDLEGDAMEAVEGGAA